MPCCQGRTDFPPCHCLSPHKLQQQTLAVRNMSPAPPLLLSIALLRCAGGHTASPHSKPPLCSPAHDQLLHELLLHQIPNPGHTSMAAPEQVELHGQEQTSCMGDTVSPWLIRTLFCGCKMQSSPAQPLLAAPCSMVVDPIPARLGQQGESGPGNSTHHA